MIGPAEAVGGPLTLGRELVMREVVERADLDRIAELEEVVWGEDDGARLARRRAGGGACRRPAGTRHRRRRGGVRRDLRRLGAVRRRQRGRHAVGRRDASGMARPRHLPGDGRLPCGPGHRARLPPHRSGRVRGQPADPRATWSRGGDDDNPVRVVATERTCRHGIAPNGREPSTTGATRSRGGADGCVQRGSPRPRNAYALVAHVALPSQATKYWGRNVLSIWPCTSRVAAPASGGTSRAISVDPAHRWARRSRRVLAGPDRRLLRRSDRRAGQRGAGRSSLPLSGVSIPRWRRMPPRCSRAGDPARTLAGFSMVGRRPGARDHSSSRGPQPRAEWHLDRSHVYWRRMFASWMAAAQAAASERELLEAFFLWVYSREWHEDGTVDRLIDETLESPRPGRGRVSRAGAGVHRLGRRRRAPPGCDHPDARDRRRPDIICPPRLSRPIVEAMPHAELAVIPGAAHQPFQEKPDEYNSIVAGFWARADRSVRIAAAA